MSYLSQINYSRLFKGPETGRQALFVFLGLLCGLVAGLAVVLLPTPLIPFALVGGLILGVLMLFRPLVGFSFVIGVACLLPFGVIPVKFALTLTFLEAGWLTIFFSWFLSLVGRAKTQGQKLVTTPFSWAILLFTGFSFFCLVLGFQTLNTNDLHNYFKLILSILVFFPLVDLIRNQKSIDLILKVLILAGSLAGYVGVGLYFLDRTLQENLLLRLGPLGYPTSERVLRFRDDNPLLPQRATGTSVDPNSFGGMLVLIIALLVVQLLAPRPLFKRWLLFLMLLGPTASVILTYGRGVQLGALGVGIFVALVKYRRIFLYALPLILTGIVVLPNTFLFSSFAAGLALEDQSTRLRLSEYQNALDIIGRYPWFGIGFGYAPDPDLQAGVSSIYLTIAERMGILGLLSFLLVIILLFLFILKHFGRLKEERQNENLLALTTGIVGALTVGILDQYFFNVEFSHMSALLWVFIGLAVAQIKVGSASGAETAV